jgi:pectinesterase
MDIKDPDPEVVLAIRSAVRWFEKTKIHGIRVEYYQTAEGRRDKRVVKDPEAPPLWGRFNGLDDNRPFFCDRDGIKKYSLGEIGHERRTGYRWYTDAPREVLDRYQEWKNKYQ